MWFPYQPTTGSPDAPFGPTVPVSLRRADGRFADEIWIRVSRESGVTVLPRAYADEIGVALMGAPAYRTGVKHVAPQVPIQVRVPGVAQLELWPVFGIEEHDRVLQLGEDFRGYFDITFDDDGQRIGLELRKPS